MVRPSDRDVTDDQGGTDMADQSDLKRREASDAGPDERPARESREAPAGDGAAAGGRQMVDEPKPPPIWRRTSTIIVAAVIVVVGAIALSSTYVPADDESLAVVESFDTENYGPDTYPQVVEEIERTAVDLPELIAALQEDEDAANEQYGLQAGTGPYSFPVRGSGVAGTPEGGSVPVDIDGIDDEFTVRIQTGPVITGTALRDAVDIIGFNQFVNQMDYAAAARALNDEVKAEVLEGVDVDSLAGSEVSFVGAFTHNSDTTVTITPVELVVEP